MIFEIRAKDGLGRVAKLSINGKNIETPCLMPVINPNLPLITPKEMKRLFRTDIIIANSYTLYKSFDIENIHKFLDFDGIIVTDSGSFQLMQYGAMLPHFLIFQRNLMQIMKKQKGIWK